MSDEKRCSIERCGKKAVVVMNDAPLCGDHYWEAEKRVRPAPASVGRP